MNKQAKIQLENVEFNNIITDILANYTVQQMKNYIQHFNTTCFDHCFMVSYYCYKISKKLNWDYKSAARGAMLHDMFLYDWRKKQEDIKGLHAFTHGKTAYKKANEIFNLNKTEKDMIKNHMFPVTLIPPKTKEGFLLTIVDKYCYIKETIDYYLHIIKRRKYIYQ